MLNNNRYITIEYLFLLVNDVRKCKPNFLDKIVLTPSVLSTDVLCNLQQYSTNMLCYIQHYNLETHNKPFGNIIRHLGIGPQCVMAVMWAPTVETTIYAKVCPPVRGFIVREPTYNCHILHAHDAFGDSITAIQRSLLNCYVIPATHKVFLSRTNLPTNFCTNWFICYNRQPMSTHIRFEWTN